MNTRQTLWMTAVTAFASGFLAGLLFAPQRGREVRRRIAHTAQGSTRWVGDRLHDLEDQLDTLEQRIQATSKHLGVKVQEAAQKAVDQYVPTLPVDAEAWNVEGDDLIQDLRHVPRK